MQKVDKTVLRETRYIAFVVIVLSVLMNSIFLIFRQWDYKVLLGTLLSATVAIFNFLFMGITIQNALKKDSEDAKKLIKASQSIRNLGVFVIIGAGVIIPCFNEIAVIIPLLFPRIAISFYSLREKRKKDVIEE